MSRKNLIIDNLNIRLPSGWGGDPVLLARRISQQLQDQAQLLDGTKQISIALQGSFSGVENRVTEQLSNRLKRDNLIQSNQSNERESGNKHRVKRSSSSGEDR